MYILKSAGFLRAFDYRDGAEVIRLVAEILLGDNEIAVFGMYRNGALVLRNRLHKIPAINKWLRSVRVDCKYLANNICHSCALVVYLDRA